MRLINRSRLKYKSLAIGGGFFTQQHQQSLRGCLPRRPEQGASPLHPFQTLAAGQRGKGSLPLSGERSAFVTCQGQAASRSRIGANLDTSQHEKSPSSGLLVIQQIYAPTSARHLKSTCATALNVFSSVSTCVKSPVSTSSSCRRRRYSLKSPPNVTSRLLNIAV